MDSKYCCPNCGSDEFMTSPNQYDILTFSEAGIEIQSTEQVYEYELFCRECGEGVEFLESEKKIILKN